MHGAAYTTSYTEESGRADGTTGSANSRGQRAYGELKRRLLVGEFPLTARLGESALADQLDMSRTPIREALSRLHAEGLVVRRADGGYSPAAPELHVITELYEVRRSLEFTALQRGDHDPRAVQALADDWRDVAPPSSDAECPPDFVLLDEAFHIRLASAAGNRSLVELLVGINERIRMVRMQDFLTADRIVATIAEHHLIATTLLTDGPEASAAVLGRHLDVSEHVVEQRAALAVARMLGSGS
jgi:DNA-binding GntR family transcriptional regulator